MKITGINSQLRDKNRVNIMVDGTYRFSLDVAQVVDLAIKVGQEYDDEALLRLENESQFGKLYNRTLEYCLMRPHSCREVRDYLYKKTRDTPLAKDGIKKGVSAELTHRVFDRLLDRGYIDDEKFTQFWVENRQLKKGISKRKLQAELRAKGVQDSVINKYLSESSRDEFEELKKVIIKKRRRYDDEQKLIQYLARLGFGYDDIKRALEEA